VPLHPARLADRGFNQAVLLARVVARHTGWPLLPRALARTRSTSAQARLGAADRKTNVADAFRVRSRVEGLDVLLVDDVTTTGATLAACASALRRAGARSVTPITVAIQDLDGAGVSRGSGTER
jgi:ComF family protein